MCIERIAKELSEHFYENIFEPPTKYTIQLILESLTDDNIKDLYLNSKSYRFKRDSEKFENGEFDE